MNKSSVCLTIFLVFTSVLLLAQPQHIPDVTYTNDDICNERPGHSSVGVPNGLGGFSSNTLWGY